MWVVAPNLVGETFHSGQWCSQTIILGVQKFDFRRVTVFCLGYRPSKHKMTRYAKNLGVMAPWLRLSLWVAK